MGRQRRLSSSSVDYKEQVVGNPVVLHSTHSCLSICKKVTPRREHTEYYRKYKEPSKQPPSIQQGPPAGEPSHEVHRFYDDCQTFSTRYRLRAAFWKAAYADSSRQMLNAQFKKGGETNETDEVSTHDEGGEHSSEELQSPERSKQDSSLLETLRAPLSEGPALLDSLGFSTTLSDSMQLQDGSDDWHSAIDKCWDEMDHPTENLLRSAVVQSAMEAAASPEGQANEEDDELLMRDAAALRNSFGRPPVPFQQKIGKIDSYSKNIVQSKSLFELVPKEGTSEQDLLKRAFGDFNVQANTFVLAWKIHLQDGQRGNTVAGAVAILRQILLSLPDIRSVKEEGLWSLVILNKAEAAINAACTARRYVEMLRHTSLNQIVLGLSCAVSCGEVVVSEDDIYGDPVDVCVELAAAAQPGEIFVETSALPAHVEGKSLWFDADVIIGKRKPLGMIKNVALDSISSLESHKINVDALLEKIHNAPSDIQLACGLKLLGGIQRLQLDLINDCTEEMVLLYVDLKSCKAHSHDQIKQMKLVASEREALKEEIRVAGGNCMKLGRHCVVATFDAPRPALEVALNAAARRHRAVSGHHVAVALELGELLTCDTEVFGTPWKTCVALAELHSGLHVGNALHTMAEEFGSSRGLEFQVQRIVVDGKLTSAYSLNHAQILRYQHDLGDPQVIQKGKTSHKEKGDDDKKPRFDFSQDEEDDVNDYWRGGFVSLRILGAMNLPPLDAAHSVHGCRKLDCFVKVTVDGLEEVFCTEVRKKTLDPIWNAACEFEMPVGCNEVVLFLCHGQPDIKEEPLGHVTLHVINYIGKGNVEKYYKIEKNDMCPRAKGKIRLDVSVQEDLDEEHMKVVVNKRICSKTGKEVESTDSISLGQFKPVAEVAPAKPSQFFTHVESMKDHEKPDSKAIALAMKEIDDLQQSLQRAEQEKRFYQDKQKRPVNHGATQTDDDDALPEMRSPNASAAPLCDLSRRWENWIEVVQLGSLSVPPPRVTSEVPKDEAEILNAMIDGVSSIQDEIKRVRDDDAAVKGDSKSAAAVEETLAAELAALQMSSADMAAENAQLQEDLLTLEGWAKRFLPTSESPQEQLPSEDPQGMEVPAANEELVRMQRQVMQETAELEAELQRLQQAIAQKKEDNARSPSPDKGATAGSTASRTLKGKPAASKGGSSSNKLLPGGAQGASPSKSAGTGSSNMKALSPRASGVAPPKSPRASAQLQTKSGSAPRPSGQPSSSRGLNLPGATSSPRPSNAAASPKKGGASGGLNKPGSAPPKSPRPGGR